MDPQPYTDCAALQARIAALEAELAVLRDKATLAETLLAHIPPIIERFDRQCRHLYISPAFERLTGHSPEADLGKTSRELGAPEAMVTAFESAIQAVFDTGRPTEIEYDYTPLNQSTRHYRAQFVPEFGPDGSVQTVLAIEHDITQQRQVYEQVATLTQYQQAIIDNAQVYISAMDTQRNALIWNAAAERITGFSRAEVLGNHRIYDWLYPEPEERQAVLATVAELLDETHSGEVTFLRQMHTRSGEVRTLSFQSRRLRGPDGRAIGYFNIGVDITDYLQAQAALTEERNLLRTLFDHLPDAIFLKDAAGRYVTCNLAFARLHGFDAPEALIGLTTFDYDPPELAQCYHADDMQVIRSGEPLFDREEPVVDAAGQTRWYLTTKIPRRDAAGNVIGLIGISHDITERKAAEEALRESEARFREVAEHLGQALSIRVPGPAGTTQILYVNPTYEALFGISAAEAYASDTAFLRWVHPDDRPRVQAALEAYLTEAASDYSIEYRLVKPDGAVRWVWARAFAIRDEHGRMVRSIGLAEDVTDRKAAAEALAEERNLLRTLIDALPDAIYLKDADSRFVICNTANARLKGFASPEEVVGKTTFDVDPPDLAAHYTAADRRVMESGEPLLNQEEIIEDASGRRRWYSTTKVPRRDAAGNIIGLIGLSRDITEWKAAAQQREDQLRFEALLATIANNFVGVRVDEFADRVRRNLRALGDYLGIDRVSLLEITDDQWFSVVASWAAAGFEPLPPGSGLGHYPGGVQALRRGETVKVSSLDAVPSEWPLDRQSLAQAGVHAVLAVPLRTGEEPLGILTCSCLGRTHDWPEAIVQRVELVGQVFASALARAHADRALRQSEERFRTMADFTYDWEHWMAPDGSIVCMSPACERITGYRREEFVADPTLLRRIVHPDDLAAYDEHVQAAESHHQVRQIEFRVVARTGETRWIGHVCQPVYSDDGSWLGWRSSNRDITARKQAEAEQARLQAQLLQAQKMEAIGRLTAGIAHDFNNLLTVINGFAELLKMHLPPEADASGYADKIITAGQRAASLVSKLMAFGRKQMLQPRVVDLNEILAGMGALLHRLIGEDIALQEQLADGLWPVKVDPTQIEQVIVNLAVNARDAMPTGGRLTIKSANVTLPKERLIGAEIQPAGDYVRLTIADSGIGMSQEVKAHLFEPFFTTKPLGQGTGLGLATVYGIVRQSDGFVEVASEEGQGTRFDIYLPRAPEEAPEPRKRSTGPLAPSGVETVVVVEDDPGVRRLACEVLRERGYHVLEAEDAAAALRLAADYDGRIHLLISDVVMPGIGGRELAQQMGALRPDLKVILMSGYSGDMIANRGSLPPGIEFVQKPISAVHLAQTVRQVLDRR